MGPWSMTPRQYVMSCLCSARQLLFKIMSTCNMLILPSLFMFYDSCISNWSGSWRVFFPRVNLCQACLNIQMYITLPTCPCVVPSLRLKPHERNIEWRTFFSSSKTSLHSLWEEWDDVWAFLRRSLFPLALPCCVQCAPGKNYWLCWKVAISTDEEGFFLPGWLWCKHISLFNINYVADIVHAECTCDTIHFLWHNRKRQVVFWNTIQIFPRVWIVTWMLAFTFG